MRSLLSHLGRIAGLPSVLAAAGLILLAASPGFAAGAQRPPNIVYIMLDEWGYFESSGMGHPLLKTPNIDRMATEGMRFTRMHAGANVCAPTRCTLMTGKHTGHATVRANGGGLPMRADDVTLATVLKRAGYATGGFGKWGLGDRGTTGVPEKHGFDVFFGYYHQVHAHSFFPNYLLRNSEKVPLPGNTGDFEKGATFSQDLIFAESVKFIREHKDGPFFAYLPWTPPHGRWGMPEDEPAWKQFKDAPWQIANSANARGCADVRRDDRDGRPPDRRGFRAPEGVEDRRQHHRLPERRQRRPGLLRRRRPPRRLLRPESRPPDGHPVPRRQDELLRGGHLDPLHRPLARPYHAWIR